MAVNTASNASPIPQANSALSATTAIAPSNVPAEVIGSTVRALSNIPAQRFKNAGYLVDEPQALEDGKTLKPCVDALIDKWLPHVGPYALEFSFAAAVLSIVFRQYKAGEDFRTSQYAKPDQPKSQATA